MLLLAVMVGACAAPPSTTPSRPAPQRSSADAEPDRQPRGDVPTSHAIKTRSAAAEPDSKPPGLPGDRRNALAFAPLDNPSEMTVEGRVSRSPAWSTSKVLVVAAVIDTVADGDPDRLNPATRREVRAALNSSDADAIRALRHRIPGSPGAAMTKVLRSIGDRTTTAPDNYQGLMTWSTQNQVRFMAALSAGRVVSPRASAYILRRMRPVRSQAWGLGTAGASAYKGGWLRGDTVTRQMGIVDGYAVAIITDAVGPAVLQSDGDSAHVRQMNRLAKLLRARLTWEQGHR